MGEDGVVCPSAHAGLPEPDNFAFDGLVQRVVGRYVSGGGQYGQVCRGRLESVREGFCVVAVVSEEVDQPRSGGTGRGTRPVPGVGPVECFLDGGGAQAQRHGEAAFVVGGGPFVWCW